MSNDYRAVDLVSDDAEMYCWLDDDPRLKPGVRLTLVEIPDRVWTIKRLYNKQSEHQRRVWRVGGVHDR